WYRKNKLESLKNAESLDMADLGAGDIYVGVQPPDDEAEWERDEDVMDTWFSSWLWPFATMANVGEDSATLRKFYPTTDLVTGPDIIFFWVARMIMAGYRFAGGLPFKNVFFTSIIRDHKGEKLSKSLGNSPDPVELMEKYGADGLRFGLMRIAPMGGDIRYNEDAIGEGRNFANKLYNACRFRQMGGNVEFPESSEENDDEDGEVVGMANCFHIDILAKLDKLAVDLERVYGEYRFGEIAQLLSEFLWAEFCDKFLEAVKGDLRESATPEARAVTLSVFDTVMSRFLQLLHPYMPHVTEELSLRMGYVAEGEFLMLAELPDEAVLAGLSDEDIATEQTKAAAIYEAVGRLRNLKVEYNVATRKDVTFVVKGAPDWFAEETPVLALLVGAQEIVLDSGYEGPKGTPVALTPIGEVYLPLEGLIDVEAEKVRLTREINKIQQELERSVAKLGNESFVARAPAEVVEQEKARLEDWKAKLAQLGEMLASLA
ncbi:MAG: valyl-tRNA synthetase, partial [Akkermansiaceae bacterium]|nr:valyl-tRNA synthetase [Akkermansiaceae bacterium]